LGANGAGKSTLLRLLLGLLEPAAGEVTLAGKPLSAWPRREVAQRLAYVPQAHTSIFPYTVLEVATMGRLPLGGLLRSPSRADVEAAEAALERLKIAPLAARPYTEISGGERQLALIARALCQGAKLMILDEPATGLDYGHQLRLLAHLHDLAAAGYGILMSTHHPAHAKRNATRVLMLDQGKIAAAGNPDEVLTAPRLAALYDVAVEEMERAGLW